MVRRNGEKKKTPTTTNRTEREKNVPTSTALSRVRRAPAASAAAVTRRRFQFVTGRRVVCTVVVVSRAPSLRSRRRVTSVRRAIEFFSFRSLVTRPLRKWLCPSYCRFTAVEAELARPDRVSSISRVHLAHSHTHAAFFSYKSKLGGKPARDFPALLTAFALRLVTKHEHRQRVHHRRRFLEPADLRVRSAGRAHAARQRRSAHRRRHAQARRGFRWVVATFHSKHYRPFVRTRQPFLLPRVTRRIRSYKNRTLLPARGVCTRYAGVRRYSS